MPTPDPLPSATSLMLMALPAGTSITKNQGTAVAGLVSFVYPKPGAGGPAFMEIHFPSFIGFEPFHAEAAAVRKIIFATLKNLGVVVPSPHSLPVEPTTPMLEWFNQECLTALEDKVSASHLGNVIVHTREEENNRLSIRCDFKDESKIPTPA